MGRFVVRLACAVVADLRVGENYDLPGIRGIGENLLISGNGSVENDFAGAFGGRTKAPALEDRSVFQGQDCRIQQIPPGGGVKAIVACEIRRDREEGIPKRLLSN